MENKFARYAEILRDWNQRMNLVAPGTLADIETRHIADSVQLSEYLPPVDKSPMIYDLGSGAGFPGVVLAIMGYSVVCIESIAKKAGFLIELKKELDLQNLSIFNGRVEDYVKTGIKAGSSVIFTARAFAPLVRIFDWAYTKNTQKADFLLLKGRAVESEIAEAEKKYDFGYELFPSKTGDGFVLSIKNLHIKKLFHVK